MNTNFKTEFHIWLEFSKNNTPREILKSNRSNSTKIIATKESYFIQKPIMFLPDLTNYYFTIFTKGWLNFVYRTWLDVTKKYKVYACCSGPEIELKENKLKCISPGDMVFIQDTRFFFEKTKNISAFEKADIFAFNTQKS